ncbi:hypothetical protein MPH_13305 [Macrophomina phaseolina MS6]|uniref:Monooxygenase FAD-binding protein n=1 Tax=Macrophomina phaseolina (strain MS6) TaxID=1126212 RepID=K2RYX9_MACPH|nr:hypothetical protein MPH_13305 [Macrophomina phaseolina MS6]
MAVAAGVTIETGKRVIDYAADGRGVVLDGGAVRGADVVVAADGVHSRATEIVLGEKKAARATGHSAFRFLIPTARINESPEISQILDDSDGCLKVFFDDSGRRLVWYDCRGQVPLFEEQSSLWLTLRAETRFRTLLPPFPIQMWTRPKVGLADGQTDVCFCSPSLRLEQG